MRGPLSFLRYGVQARCNFPVDTDGSATCIRQLETRPATESNALRFARNFLDNDKCTDASSRHPQRKTRNIEVIVVSRAACGRRRSTNAGFGHPKTI